MQQLPLETDLLVTTCLLIKVSEVPMHNTWLLYKFDCKYTTKMANLCPRHHLSKLEICKSYNSSTDNMLPVKNSEQNNKPDVHKFNIVYKRLF